MGAKKFQTLMEYINELRSGYYKALSAFYAYEALREAKAINIHGQSKAEANVVVLNTFKNFFLPAEEALRVYFFLELAKLFDASDQSLHINKVVNFTESNVRDLNVDAFKEYNSEQPRAFLDDLVNEYKGVAHDDLTEIRDLLKTHDDALEKLKTYRDKWLAHNDINKPDLPDITGEEIRALFDVLAKILNSLTSKLNSSTSLWDHVERDTKWHVNMVIDYLHRFEPYRLKEIDEECKRKIEEYKS